jgi:uncharacterized membrane protein HdeD (DUF308 family)
MMARGLVAVALPHVTTLAVELFVGWLFFVGGLFRALTVLKARHAPGFWWSLLTAVLALAFGLVLIAKPTEGVLTLTMVLILLFIVEGVAAISIALDLRRHLRNWGWTFFSGFVVLVLAYLLWQGWPATADWVIGLLVGINMFMLGVSLAMTAITARAVGPR